MICRKCSEIIPDGSEKCPVCNKNPGNSTGKTKSKILTGITFIVCFLFASALIALGLKASDVETGLDQVNPFPIPTTPLTPLLPLLHPQDFSLEESQYCVSSDLQLTQGRVLSVTIQNSMWLSSAVPLSHPSQLPADTEAKEETEAMPHSITQYSCEQPSTVTAASVCHMPAWQKGSLK